MKLSAQIGGRERDVLVEATPDPGRWRVVIDGVERLVDARRFGPRSWSLMVDGQVRCADVEAGKEGELLVDVRGVGVPVKLLDPRKALLEKVHVAKAREASGPTLVRSPMPGRVVKILVKPGDDVAMGQGLVIIEAMKMENELRASRAGKVEKLHVAEGQPVEAQESLITLV